MSARQVVVVGSCNLDVTVEVPRLPAAGETTLGADAVSQPGGKGANQAVAARRLGADTAFVGALGADQFGATLRAALTSADLDLSGLVTLDAPSGVALILVDRTGENVIAVSSGANRRLAPAHLTGLSALLDSRSVLLLQLETPTATGLAAAGAARAADARVVLNAAPTTAPDDPDLRRLLELTDVLVVNAGEALALTDAPRPSGADEWLMLAGRLRECGPVTVVITLGADGAVVAGPDTALGVPSHPVTAIDSTGAGDAFCGAFAAALAANAATADAVRRGCLAGALATTAVGAQAALPTAADLDHAARTEA